MREAMGYTAKAVSDHRQKELLPEEILELFKKTFENTSSPLTVEETHFEKSENGVVAEIKSSFNQKPISVKASGNGSLNAVSNALKKAYGFQYEVVTYQEHALEKSSHARAIAYVGIQKPDGALAWGAGVHEDIIHASIDALVAAINNR